jgi:hypothetical protein
VHMSEDKVRTKDSCWSVVTIYDPRELPEVSTTGLGLNGVLQKNGSLINSLKTSFCYFMSPLIQVLFKFSTQVNL